MLTPVPNHVSFRGPFNKDHTTAQPAGRDIADLLAAGLAKVGIQVLGRSQTDYSHELAVALGGKRFHLVVGLVEDDHAEWLIFFEPRGVLNMLFSSLTRAQQASLATSVHSLLSTDSRISEVRWYKNAEVWNHGSRDACTNSPQA